MFLVTGGAGFIGSHLVDALIQRGERVRVLDNFQTGNIANLAHLRDDIDIVTADLRDTDAVRRAMEGVEVVLHHAALASVQRSIADPRATHDVNATATLELLKCAHEAGARRVVFASSSSIYGNSPTLPKHEAMPSEPLSPYAVSKLAAEQYCRVWTEVYDLPTIALRYFNVFGPRQDPLSEYAAVIPRFATAMLAGRAPIIYGDGLQSRDFTYVENVVRANLLAADAPAHISGIFNVAAGDRISLLDLVTQINRIIGTNIVPQHEPERRGDVKHSQASIERIGEVLGFEPLVTFDEGLRRTVAFFQQTGAV